MIGRRGFLGALLAAPVLARFAPIPAAPIVGRPLAVGGVIQGDAFATSGQALSMSEALLRSYPRERLFVPLERDSSFETWHSSWVYTNPPKDRV